MAKWSHFYNFPAAFLNETPKPDMLKKNISHRHSGHYAYEKG